MGEWVDIFARGGGVAALLGVLVWLIRRMQADDGRWQTLYDTQSTELEGYREEARLLREECRDLREELEELRHLT